VAARISGEQRGANRLDESRDIKVAGGNLEFFSAD
jgi:hypothetical protein